MSQATNAYYMITALLGFREKERLRTKARHNEVQALYNARKEITQKLLRRNRTINDTVEVPDCPMRKLKFCIYRVECI